MHRLNLKIPAPIAPIFWGLIFVEAAYGAYLGVLPLWIEELGAPVAIVGLLLGASGFLRLFVLVPSAAFADRFGYRRVILIARTITVIGLIAAAVATRWQQLFILVVGVAIGELIFPLLQSLVASQAGDQRMRAFALVFTVGPSVALAIGPLLSGLLVAIAGMRAAFVLAAVFGAASLFFFRRIEEPVRHPSRDTSQQSGYREAVANPAIRTITALLIVTVFSLSLGVSFIPTFLDDVRGFEPATIATFGALAAVGSALFGILVARARRLQKAPFIAVTIAITSVVIALSIIHSASALVLICVAYLFRGGFFSSWAMLNAAVGVNAPAQHRARGFALAEMAGGMANALGPITAGLLYSRRATLPFEVAIVLAVSLIPLMLLVNRSSRRWEHEDAVVLVVPEPEPALLAPADTPSLVTDAEPLEINTPAEPAQATTN